MNCGLADELVVGVPAFMVAEIQYVRVGGREISRSAGCQHYEAVESLRLGGADKMSREKDKETSHKAAEGEMMLFMTFGWSPQSRIG